MSRPPRRRPATWEELEQVPEDLIGEIVAGEIVVTPRPDVPHMEVTSFLGDVLSAPFRRGIGGPGGWVIFDEPRIRFGEDVRVPDLGGWRKERWVNVPRRGPIPILPDWICEVLSRATERQDRTTKMALYARAKIRHLWLITPESRTLEVYRLEPAGWLLTGTHADRDRVRVEPFDAIEFDLSLLWGESFPEPEESENP